jgi:RAT1-interacting protein
MLTGYHTVLKKTVAGDGVWRIKRRHKSPLIEVSKITDSGNGGILSAEFTAWREHLLDRETVGTSG